MGINQPMGIKIWGYAEMPLILVISLNVRTVHLNVNLWQDMQLMDAYTFDWVGPNGLHLWVHSRPTSEQFAQQ